VVVIISKAFERFNTQLFVKTHALKLSLVHDSVLKVFIVEVVELTVFLLNHVPQAVEALDVSFVHMLEH
jgi:hypothetical protein